jgi:uncharacterized membrane protein
MKTVVGLFDTYHATEQAIDALEQIGIMREQISIVARDTVLREQGVEAQDQATTQGAGTGAVSGTAVGGVAGLLAGVSAIILPGIGPVLTAGTLLTVSGATALGAGVGAATGSMIGALQSANVVNADAQVYAESVRQGGIVITIRVQDDQVSSVLAALERANAVDIVARREELRRSGWQQFDESATPPADHDSKNEQAG